MKEATGELNMTVITIVAIAVIGGILALMWDPITTWIQNSFGTGAATTCPDGQTWTPGQGCTGGGA